MINDISNLQTSVLDIYVDFSLNQVPNRSYRRQLQPNQIQFSIYYAPTIQLFFPATNKIMSHLQMSMPAVSPVKSKSPTMQAMLFRFGSGGAQQIIELFLGSEPKRNNRKQDLHRG